VYEQARADLPGLTEPTVYRTLEFLARHGYAMASQRRNGKLAYELAETDHHHLICRNCGSSMEIAHASLEKLYHQLESSTGYSLNSSHVTLFGLCPKCQK
jgi:Fe2+ or Zn2+ uptake regulation protein